MKLKYIATSLLIFLSIQLIPASANAQTCSELLLQIGRLYESDSGKSPQLPLNHKAKISDCNSAQLEHFQTDFTSIKTAKGVQDRNQLLGTWVRDDVLAVYTGLFIPAYEILEITPGNGDQEIVITQKVIRAHDPAVWFTDPMNVSEPIEIVSAGRRPTIGILKARLSSESTLVPRKIEYFSVPLETDRGTDLTMKAQLLSLQHNKPFETKIHDDRLVFSYRDRAFGKKVRILTFRKRKQETIDTAMRISMIGEKSMAHFHCFLNTIESQNNAYKKALGNLPHTAFVADLAKLEELFDQQTNLFNQGAASELTKAERDNIREQILAIRDQIEQSVKSGALSVLNNQASNGGIFGCSLPY